VYFNCKSRKAIGLALAEIGTRRIEFPIAHSSRGGRVKDIRNAIEEIKKSSNDLQAILQCRAFEDDVKNASQYGADGCTVFLGVTQKHRKGKLGGMNRGKAIEQLSKSIELLKDFGFRYRRAVFEDVSRFFTSEKSSEDNSCLPFASSPFGSQGRGYDS